MSDSGRFAALTHCAPVFLIRRMQGQPPQGPPKPPWSSGYPPPPSSPPQPAPYAPTAYGQPAPYQPGPYQPGPYQPGPYQPGPPPQGGPYGAPPPQPPYGYPLPRPPAPPSKPIALYVIGGLVGLFLAFYVYRRIQVAGYVREYEKREAIRKEEEAKRKDHAADVTAAATKKADAVRKALDACKARESQAIETALGAALKPGTPALVSLRAPKTADKPRLNGAIAYSMPTDKDPTTAKPTKIDYGISSPWIAATGGSRCPDLAGIDADALKTTAAAPPSTYASDVDKEYDDWEARVQAATKKLAKPKDLDAIEPPKAIAIVNEDCTQSAVDSFIGTSGLGVGQKNEVYAYSCKYSVSWIAVPDGALLAAVVTSAYASPKRYLPDNVTVDEISTLNDETSQDAEEKGAKAIKATLASWGGQ